MDQTSFCEGYFQLPSIVYYKCATSVIINYSTSLSYGENIRRPLNPQENSPRSSRKRNPRQVSLIISDKERPNRTPFMMASMSSQKNNRENQQTDHVKDNTSRLKDHEQDSVEHESHDSQQSDHVKDKTSHHKD